MTHALSSIDPRIRARRIAVRRAEGRRRLRILAWAGVVVAVILAAYGLTRTPLLDLDHVDVAGVAGAEAAAVLDAVGPVTGTALLDVDTGPVAERVEALPWVERAEVDRAWPGTLEIAVTPRVPVALIEAGEGTVATVDATSTVIEVGPAPAAAAPEAALPSIDGAHAVAPGAMQLAATPARAGVAARPDDVRAWVDGVSGDPSGGAGLVLDLVGSARAELGDTSLLPDKLEALRAVLAGAELDCVAVIDVSVADLSTVTRDPACHGGAVPADG